MERLKSPIIMLGRLEKLLISNNFHMQLHVLESYEGGQYIHINKTDLFRLDLIETYSHDDDICILVGHKNGLQKITTPPPLRDTRSQLNIIQVELHKKREPVSELQRNVSTKQSISYLLELRSNLRNGILFLKLRQLAK